MSVKSSSAELSQADRDFLDRNINRVWLKQGPHKEVRRLHRVAKKRDFEIPSARIKEHFAEVITPQRQPAAAS